MFSLLPQKAWKIKSEEFQIDQKYFAKQNRKSWKPENIVMIVKTRGISEGILQIVSSD